MLRTVVQKAYKLAAPILEMHLSFSPVAKGRQEANLLFVNLFCSILTGEVDGFHARNCSAILHRRRTRSYSSDMHDIHPIKAQGLK